MMMTGLLQRVAVLFALVLGCCHDSSAAHLPRMAFNLRTSTPLYSSVFATTKTGSKPTVCRDVSTTTSKEPMTSRGGATAIAVKTMTARQMEIFK